MATGTVVYWNGGSGWIKQTNVEDMPTSQAGDALFLAADVTGEIVPDASVSFTMADGWRALEVTVL